MVRRERHLPDRERAPSKWLGFLVVLKDDERIREGVPTGRDLGMVRSVRLLDNGESAPEQRHAVFGAAQASLDDRERPQACRDRRVLRAERAFLDREGLSADPLSVGKSPEPETEVREVPERDGDRGGGGAPALQESLRASVAW